jgi:hypothetical protein
MAGTDSSVNIGYLLVGVCWIVVVFAIVSGLNAMLCGLATVCSSYHCCAIVHMCFATMGGMAWRSVTLHICLVTRIES